MISSPESYAFASYKEESTQPSKGYQMTPGYGISKMLTLLE